MSDSRVAPPVDESRIGYEGWRVAGASSVGVFFASILIYGFAVLLKPLTQEFAWSRETGSLAYAVMALSAALSAPAFGLLLDRYGPARIVIPSLAACGCGIASLALLTAAPVHVYLLFTLLGFSVMGTSPLAYSRAVSTWFDRRRGVALATVLAGAAIASIVHPPAIDVLITAVGWRLACVVLGGLVLCVGLPVVAGFVRERAADSRRRADSRFAGVTGALRTWKFWVLVAAIAGASLANNAITVHLPSLLTDRGVPSGRAALTLSAMGGANLVGRLVTGWLIDRIRASYVAAALMTMAAYGILRLHDAQTFEGALIAVILLGFGMGGELDIAPFVLSRYFGLRMLSTLYGFVWTVMGFAAAAGSILMGRAFDSGGSYDMMLMRLAASTLAVAALMLVLPRYDLRMPEEPLSTDLSRSGRN